MACFVNSMSAFEDKWQLLSFGGHPTLLYESPVMSVIEDTGFHPFVVPV
jgi:hypothetical protein